MAEIDTHGSQSHGTQQLALVDGPGHVSSVLGRGCLWLASYAYGGAVCLHNKAYEWGLKTIHRAPLPVVSVGNITTGGTGKTPFCAWMARWFRARDYRAVFVSRGYGADPGQLNDEALVLEQLCPDVPHLQHPDRVASVRIAREELASQVAILDDGFQHRRLARDLDIVLIDATVPWGYGYLLPRGLLREPLVALRRAQVVVMTRVDQVSPTQLGDITRRIQKIRGASGLVYVRYSPHQLVNASGEICRWESLPLGPKLAFCGIGNPAAFRDSLQTQGVTVSEQHWHVYPDHHPYSRLDVEQLERWAETSGGVAALCTQKDLVKLGMTHLGGLPLWAVEQTTDILRGEEILNQHLESIAAKIPPDDDSTWE